MAPAATLTGEEGDQAGAGTVIRTQSPTTGGGEGQRERTRDAGPQRSTRCAVVRGGGSYYNP